MFASMSQKIIFWRENCKINKNNYIHTIWVYNVKLTNMHLKQRKTNEQSKAEKKVKLLWKSAVTSKNSRNLWIQWSCSKVKISNRMLSIRENFSVQNTFPTLSRSFGMTLCSHSKYGYFLFSKERVQYSWHQPCLLWMCLHKPVMIMGTQRWHVSYFIFTLEVESFINFHHHFQFVLLCAVESVYLLEFPSLLFPVSLPLFSEEPCLLSDSGMNLGGLSELFSQLRRRGCVKASASWQERGAISPDKAMADLRIVTKQTAWMQVGTRQRTCISPQPKIQDR